MTGSDSENYEDAVEMVELAMDDHHSTRQNLERAQSRLATKALFASAVAEGIYNSHQKIEEDYEEFAEVVSSYLMQDASNMDDRAVRLAEVEDALDELIDESREPFYRRREFLGALGGAAGAAIGTGYLLLEDGQDSQSGTGSANPYSSLPQQGDRIEWSEASQYLTEESMDRIRDTTSELGVEVTQGSYEFHYQGVENGSMTGYTEVYFPDDSFGQDEDSEAEEIEFDNVVYRQVK